MCNTRKENSRTAIRSGKHLASLRSSYGRAICFKDYYPYFEEVLGRQWTYLKDLNIEIIKFILKELSIDTPITFESDLDVTTMSTRRIIDICKKLKADTYLSGSGGKNYLDEVFFQQSGLQLIYQEFKHPQYQQCYEPFKPFMSVIDLLFNQGKKSREILLSL
ncbi:MAG: WbqC family protein [Candidatus Omnitrophica bacterium]|nr:WbqC family protein [Candidatus Omnitrophota bacterium]